MPQGAQAAALRDLPVATPAPRPMRALVVGAAEPDAGEQVIRRLAADRLRDLADDGVTLACMARMYDIPADHLERLREKLIPSRL